MTGALTPAVDTGTHLARYEAACRAIAEARAVDEIKNIHDTARQMAAAARIAKNRELEADAFEIRVRAERRLGEMMTAAKSSGDLASGPGRPRKNGSVTEPFPATLAEIKVDKKLSARAQKLRAIPAAEFEAMVAEGRDEVQRAAERRTIKAVEIAQARASYEARAEVGSRVEDLVAVAASGRRFGVILADPPWEFHTYSWKGKQRSAERYYDCKSIADVMALPVAALAAKDCALFLWSVCPELPGALDVVRAWGFEFKTKAFTWIKQNPSGKGLHTGTGYWTRANSEDVWLATRGNPQRLDMGVHQVVMAPVGKHSEKPAEVHGRIERLLAGPYLELFARAERPGWTAWGNEIAREAAP